MRVPSIAAVVLVGTALLFFQSCSPGSPEPDDAREELRRRGIESNQGSFNDAILAGDAELVDLLLEARVRPRRGLRLAAKEGQCDVLARLLDVEYRVDGILAAEALAWALFNEHDACVELLEAAGADLRAPNRAGDNALTKAAQQGNVPYLKVLIAVGMNPDEPDRNGKTALIEAVEGRRRNSIRELMGSGADINTTDLDGWTALAYAAWNGSDKLVRLLVNLGADPDLPTDTGWTPLGLAAFKGYGSVLRSLLRGGADPNAESEAALTPLMRAAQRGDRQMVQMLLRAGANRELSIDGVNAAWWAEIGGHEAVARMLAADIPAGTDRS